MPSFRFDLSAPAQVCPGRSDRSPEDAGLFIHYGELQYKESVRVGTARRSIVRCNRCTCIDELLADTPTGHGVRKRVAELDCSNRKFFVRTLRCCVFSDMPSATAGLMPPIVGAETAQIGRRLDGIANPALRLLREIEIFSIRSRDYQQSHSEKSIGKSANPRIQNASRRPPPACNPPTSTSTGVPPVGVKSFRPAA